MSQKIGRAAHMNQPKENTYTALLVAGRLLLSVDSVPLADQIYTITAKVNPVSEIPERRRWKIEKKNKV